MTKYSQNYISTHDIDWFAKVTLPNGQIIPIHIASRGTELPDVVNNKEQNRRIQTIVARNRNNLITIESEYIPISIIRDIYK